MAQTTQPNQALDGAALLSSLSQSGGEGGDQDLWQQVERAAQDLDTRRAELVCEALLAHLAEQPEALRELRALVVLGLAHPKALASRRGFLAQEGRRLAGLLEARGETAEAQALLEMLARVHPDDRRLDHELASLMQRSGNADRLVERYMHRAEEALAEGRRDEAVQWLREVLSVDRSRRDAARMIRDLQYEVAARRRAWRRRVRLAGLVLFLGAVVAVVVWREAWIDEQYKSLPPTIEGSAESYRARLAGIDTLIERNPLWLSAFRASEERAELRAVITRLESVQMRESIESRLEKERRREEAESLRLRYRLAVERGAIEEALAFLDEALEVAPLDWEKRERLEADRVALQELRGSGATLEDGAR